MMGDGVAMQGTPSKTDFLSQYIMKNQSPLYNYGGNISELEFSPSPVKPPFDSHENGDAFCHRGNVEQSVLYINQEVTSIGMPSLYDGKSESHDTIRLINCTYHLLQKHQKSCRIREELEDKIHRIESDVEHLLSCQNRLKVTIEQGQRELSQQQEKERQVIKQNKLCASKLKAEKEEVRRLQATQQQRDVQYRHDIKRRERELNKLKDRLHNLLLDKRQERRVGMEISQHLQRADGRRGTWRKDSKHEEELYRDVISTYEEKQKQLMLENSELRKSLSETQKDLVAMLHSPASTNGLNSSGHSGQNLRDLSDFGSTEEDEDGNLIIEQEEVSEGHFQMPYDIVRTGIEKSLKHKCRLLRQYIRGIEKQKGGKELKRGKSSDHMHHKDQKKDLDKLNKQLERYRGIIEQQEMMIQSLQGQGEKDEDDGEEQAFTQEEELWQEVEALSAQKRLFFEQKTHFEEERKNFTDAALRLARERKAFEEEKASFLQHQFMQLTPFQNRPQRAKSAVESSKRRQQRILPSTPASALSPHANTPLHEHVAIATPSTAELYKTLGLTNDGIDCEPTPQSADIAMSHGESSSSEPFNPSALRAGSPLMMHAGGLVRSRNSSSSSKSDCQQVSPKGVITTQRNEHLDHIKMALFVKTQENHHT